jgi:hypothetical protein
MGVYRAPELTWLPTNCPSALKFLNSPRLGSQYQSDMIVGDVNTRSLYHFKLNQNRDGLVLTGPLADKDLKKRIGLGTTTNHQQQQQDRLFVKLLG